MQIENKLNNIEKKLLEVCDRAREVSWIEIESELLIQVKIPVAALSILLTGWEIGNFNRCKNDYRCTELNFACLPWFWTEIWFLHLTLNSKFQFRKGEDTSHLAVANPLYRTEPNNIGTQAQTKSRQTLTYYRLFTLQLWLDYLRSLH